MAAKNKPILNKALIFHSDRGSEYAAHDYQNRLKALGITASMNRSGFMNDNVYLETFFQTLETESFKGLAFDTDRQVKTTLRYYM